MRARGCEYIWPSPSLHCYHRKHKALVHFGGLFISFASTSKLSLQFCPGSHGSPRASSTFVLRDYQTVGWSNPPRHESPGWQIRLIPSLFRLLSYFFNHLSGITLTSSQWFSSPPPSPFVSPDIAGSTDHGHPSLPLTHISLYRALPCPPPRIQATGDRLCCQPGKRPAVYHRGLRIGRRLRFRVLRRPNGRNGPMQGKTSHRTVRGKL